MTHRITVLYFARLREERGCGEETLETGAATLRGLYDALRERHGFTHSPDTLKVAVNDRLTTWDAPLRDGDTVLFVPPVAGG